MAAKSFGFSTSEDTPYLHFVGAEAPGVIL